MSLAAETGRPSYDLTAPVTMRKNQGHMTERILNLTLEIIYLLTGEKYAAVKVVSIEGLLQGVYPAISEEWSKGQNSIPAAPSASQISEDNDKKILDVTKKIIGLLSGEVPTWCRDVTVSSQDRANQELYKEAMMEDQPPLISPDGSTASNTPEKEPRPLYTHRAQEEHSNPHHHQGEEEIHLKVAIKEENDELYITDDLQCKQEELTPEVGAGGCSVRGTLDRCPRSPGCEVTDRTMNADSLGEYVVMPNVHPDHYCMDTYSNLSNPGASLVTPHSVTSKAHPSFQRMATSPDPSDLKESPDELHMDTPDIHSGLNRPPHCSNAKGSAPKNTRNTPDVCPGLSSASRPADLIICKRSTSDSVNPVLHSELLIDHKPPELPNLDASSPYKSHILPPNVLPGLYSADSSLYLCNSEGSIPDKPDVFTPTRHQELLNDYRTQDPSDPQASSAKSDTVAQHSAPGLFMTYRPLDPHNPEESYAGTMAQYGDCSRNETYPCSDCWKCFSTLGDLVEHRRTHTRDQPNGSANGKTLFSHQQKKHVAKKIFRCLECGICFPSSTDLLKHRYRSHTKEKPFPCSECGKCYTQKSHLVNHQRIHTGENIFPCPECGRRFTLRSQFIKHMRSHTGEKPFSCPECGRCFAQKATLDNHQSVHTGHKPFSCIECGKSFVRKDTLQKHLEIHTGVTRRAKRS